MDVSEWNPATDKYLDVNYTKSNVIMGKAAAKEALQAEVGLDVDPSKPLFGYIGRLEEQKGVDILMKVCFCPCPDAANSSCCESAWSCYPSHVANIRS
jgi:glycogen synthase